MGLRSVLLGMCAAAALAAPASAGEAIPDISGFWDLRVELPSIPEGKVTPQARARVAELRRTRGLAAPEVRWCRYIGIPFVYGMSPPIDIVQDRREVVVMGETLSAPQHIYLDRTTFPDPDAYEPTSNGFSIGRYEGDTLVAETRGFSETSGNPYIPGGGYKTSETRLIQRFRPIEGGEKLEITFTWIDPKVFEGPHTYTFTYFKSPPEAYAQEFYCDAADPAFGATVSEPPK